METSLMMMMMMIFICVQRVPSRARCPETSRRVRGRAKLRNYSTKVITLESISCKKQARRQVTMFLPRPIGVEIECVCLYATGSRPKGHYASAKNSKIYDRKAYNKGNSDKIEPRANSQLNAQGRNRASISR